MFYLMKFIEFWKYVLILDLISWDRQQKAGKVVEFSKTPDCNIPNVKRFRGDCIMFGLLFMSM